MSGSTYGNIFRITTWGESHGKGIGVVIDGCPSGLLLSEADIQKFLNRRKPGQSQYSTQRSEDDTVEILSGVFEGRTTGTPISMIVYNKTQRSSDYSEISQYYRPGHADYTFDVKYGFRDYRGGGRSSGRETIGRVAAGAVAAKLLAELGIQVCAYSRAIGGIEINDENFDSDYIFQNPLYMPDREAVEKVLPLLDEKRKEGDSVGGIIECVVRHMKPGVGEPVFDKLDADLAKALMSIGAVKAVEIGDGVNVARTFGTMNNDSFYYDENGDIAKSTNHAGGILGGISDGSDIILRAYVKPTPSIYSEQSTADKSGNNIRIQIQGRHDPIIVPRAVVVVESMTALTILDMLLVSMTSNIENIKHFFS